MQSGPIESSAGPGVLPLYVSVPNYAPPGAKLRFIETVGRSQVISLTRPTRDSVIATSCPGEWTVSRHLLTGRLLMRDSGRRRRRLDTCCQKLPIQRCSHRIGILRPLQSLAIDEDRGRRVDPDFIALGHRCLHHGIRLRLDASLQLLQVSTVVDADVQGLPVDLCEG